MIYRVFCSNFDTEEKMIKARETENALNIKYTSSFKEIEAENFINAKQIYLEKYEYVLDTLIGNKYFFYYVDSNGIIHDK